MRYERLGVFFGLFLISSILVSSHTLSMAYAVPGTGILYGPDPTTQEIFPIDPNTGLPTGAPVQILDNFGFFLFGSATALTVDPISGNMILGTGFGNPDIYILDPIGGVATLQCSFFLDPSGIQSIHSLDYDPAGDLFAAVSMSASGSGTHLADIDLNTCNIDSLVPFSSGGIGGLAFDSSGALFAGSKGANGQLYSVNIGTGFLTPIGPIDQGGQPLQNNGVLTLSVGIASFQMGCEGDIAQIFGGTGQGGFTGGLGHSDLITVNSGTGAGFDINAAASTLIGVSLGAISFDEIDTCFVESVEENVIGGELLPVNTAALLVAGAQSSLSWMVALVASVVGSGALISKKNFI